MARKVRCRLRPYLWHNQERGVPGGAADQHETDARDVEGYQREAQTECINRYPSRGAWLRRVVQGHRVYHAVPMNSRRLDLYGGLPRKGRPYRNLPSFLPVYPGTLGVRASEDPS